MTTENPPYILFVTVSLRTISSHSSSFSLWFYNWDSWYLYLELVYDCTLIHPQDILIYRNNP